MKLLFAGDVRCNDFDVQRLDICDKRLKEYVLEHDYAFCNLEGPIVNGDFRKANKVGPYTQNGVQVPQMLKSSGFNGIFLANNHIMDFGLDGLISTINEMRGGFLICGAGLKVDDVFSPIILEDESTSVAIFSICEKQFGACNEGDNNGFAWMLHSIFFLKLHEVRSIVDYVIVICHCGAEELNVPLPEVKRLYRYYIDCGVDIVIGNHPHVIQGSEVYKGKEIFYSLGNFAFDRKDNSVYNPLGLILSINMEKNVVTCQISETEYKNGLVELLKDNVEYENANKNLYSPQYDKIVENYCVDIYTNCFDAYISASIGLDYKNNNNLIKFVSHRSAGDKLMMNHAFVYHNTVVETNRWIIERAIKNLINK